MERRGSGGGDDIDTDSDETVVEGSVTESDVEEEEFRRRRWGWINHSSPTENISKPGFSLNSAAEEKQNNSVGIKLNGFQKDSEEKGRFSCTFTKQNTETSEVDISDLLRYPSDSESLKVKNPLPDKLECQGHSCSIDPSAAESSDALPVEFVAPLDALSGSMPVGGQQREKEEISDYLDATFSEKQTGGGHLYSVEPAACAETDQTTSSKSLVSKIQKSTSEDNQDLETIMWQQIILNECAEANQRRRSKRIDNKRSGDDSKNMLNTQCVEDTNKHQTKESEPACANPQKTSQKAKAASYSSRSNKKLSSNQSQLSLASKQQTSKKSESTRQEAAIVRGTCKSRPGRKTKIRRNAKGETQLHIAAKRGDLSLVKTLISSGVSVNEQDYAGWTAIHEASSGGFTEVILELLKAGADVNSRSLCGVLPIHDAVSGNYLEAARILLQHGANPNERDGSGESALDQACDEEMKELLKSYDAMDSVLPVQTVEVTDVYIQRLSQIQDTLNEILANQKTERDTIAIKYRASVESFKRGALRKQLVNLASRQKSLLTIAQNQEKLVQKIQNYRKTKQMFNSSSEKQISNLVIFHGSDERQSLTANEITCPNAVTLSMGLGAIGPSGSKVGAQVSLEDRFSAQECIQHPHICLDETAANKEAITSKEASDHALASENRGRECPSDNMSKLINAAEVMTLPSEPISTAKTKCSQQKYIDCVAIAGQRNKSLNPTSMMSTLNIVEPRSTVVSKNVYQTTSYCKQVLSHEDRNRYGNKKEAFQQQPQQAILLASTNNFSNTLKQRVLQSSEDSFNANPMLTNLTSSTDSPANISEKSSQSYGNQEWGQKQMRYGWKSKKKHQLIDLLELGWIKPGENVLEFKLQVMVEK
ncbi:hypothetical protein DUI87_06756 [Hirundo rustica rustica]|uniref:Uncharacterized protein n=1 Tax=Hirundo rustica rustica TaxID=333673 RepID=A0A3M0LAZ2_HIRRU|nr:hypothetical protein DUI87_06756 [Hirundo rustica rustica]